MSRCQNGLQYLPSQWELQFLGGDFNIFGTTDSCRGTIEGLLSQHKNQPMLFINLLKFLTLHDKNYS